MFALIHTTTDENDTNIPTLLSSGHDEQDALEQFSDSLAELMPKWAECTFTLNGEFVPTGKAIAFSEVVESFFSGNRHELTVTYSDKQSAAGWCSESWVLLELPESPRYHLVKTGKNPAGTLESPVIVASGSMEECNRAMTDVKHDSCEHFDGGNGHWEYLGSDGELVCYDIIEE